MYIGKAGVWDEKFDFKDENVKIIKNFVLHFIK
jgi:hypothetical protein